jgi:hypothetical protein
MKRLVTVHMMVLPFPTKMPVPGEGFVYPKKKIAAIAIVSRKLTMVAFLINCSLSPITLATPLAFYFASVLTRVLS